eukprot:scaffold4658_cov118-Cylindrotheca_fusiformis.AAC.17
MPHTVHRDALVSRYGKKSNYASLYVDTNPDPLDEVEQRAESSSLAEESRATEEAGRVMSEAEINEMVQTALTRARRATECLSPTKRSTGGVREPASPQYSSFLPSYVDGMFSTRPVSARTTRSDGSLLDNRNFFTPRQNSRENRTFDVEEDATYIGAATMLGTHGNIKIPMTSPFANWKTPTMPSASEYIVSSSEAIIQRVEEEIENAKKAAREASARMTEVSSYGMTPRSNFSPRGGKNFDTVTTPNETAKGGVNSYGEATRRNDFVTGAVDSYRATGPKQPVKEVLISTGENTTPDDLVNRDLLSFDSDSFIVDCDSIPQSFSAPTPSRDSEVIHISDSDENKYSENQTAYPRALFSHGHAFMNVLEKAKDECDVIDLTHCSDGSTDDVDESHGLKQQSKEALQANLENSFNENTVSDHEEPAMAMEETSTAQVVVESSGLVFARSIPSLALSASGNKETNPADSSLFIENKAASAEAADDGTRTLPSASDRKETKPADSSLCIENVASAEAAVDGTLETAQPGETTETKLIQPSATSSSNALSSGKSIENDAASLDVDGIRTLETAQPAETAEAKPLQPSPASRGNEKPSGKSVDSDVASPEAAVDEIGTQENTQPAETTEAKPVQPALAPSRRNARPSGRSLSRIARLKQLKKSMGLLDSSEPDTGGKEKKEVQRVTIPGPEDAELQATLKPEEVKLKTRSELEDVKEQDGETDRDMDSKHGSVDDTEAANVDEKVTAETKGLEKTMAFNSKSRGSQDTEDVPARVAGNAPEQSESHGIDIPITEPGNAHEQSKSQGGDVPKTEPGNADEQSKSHGGEVLKTEPGSAPPERSESYEGDVPKTEPVSACESSESHGGDRLRLNAHFPIVGSPIEAHDEELVLDSTNKALEVVEIDECNEETLNTDPCLVLQDGDQVEDSKQSNAEIAAVWHQPIETKRKEFDKIHQELLQNAENLKPDFVPEKMEVLCTSSSDSFITESPTLQMNKRGAREDFNATKESTVEISEKKNADEGRNGSEIPRSFVDENLTQFEAKSTDGDSFSFDLSNNTDGLGDALSDWADKNATTSAGIAKGSEVRKQPDSLDGVPSYDTQVLPKPKRPTTEVANNLGEQIVLENSEAPPDAKETPKEHQVLSFFDSAREARARELSHFEKNSFLGPKNKVSKSATPSEAKKDMEQHPLLSVFKEATEKRAKTIRAMQAASLFDDSDDETAAPAELRPQTNSTNQSVASLPSNEVKATSIVQNGNSLPEQNNGAEGKLKVPVNSPAGSTSSNPFMTFFSDVVESKTVSKPKLETLQSTNGSRETTKTVDASSIKPSASSSLSAFFSDSTVIQAIEMLKPLTPKKEHKSEGKSKTPDNVVIGSSSHPEKKFFGTPINTQDPVLRDNANSLKNMTGDAANSSANPSSPSSLSGLLEYVKDTAGSTNDKNSLAETSTLPVTSGNASFFSDFFQGFRKPETPTKKSQDYRRMEDKAVPVSSPVIVKPAQHDSQESPTGKRPETENSAERILEDGGRIDSLVRLLHEELSTNPQLRTNSAVTARKSEKNSPVKATKETTQDHPDVGSDALGQRVETTEPHLDGDRKSVGPQLNDDQKNEESQHINDQKDPPQLSADKKKTEAQLNAGRTKTERDHENAEEVEEDIVEPIIRKAESTPLSKKEKVHSVKKTFSSDPRFLDKNKEAESAGKGNKQDQEISNSQNGQKRTIPNQSLPETKPAEKGKGTNVQFRNRITVPPSTTNERSPQDIINANKAAAPRCKLCLVQPKEELQTLLDAIMGPSVARRFNACGALRMFSMNKKNQQTLARTDGLLDALIVAISTDLSNDDDYEAAYGARIRALEVLLKVCIPKDNRVLIFFHPDLVESLVSCAMEDDGEVRVVACSVLAMLAKTHYLREPMANVDGLIDVLSIALLGLEDEEELAGKQGSMSDSDEDDTFGRSSSQTSDEGASSADEKFDDLSERGSGEISNTSADEMDNPIHTRCLEILGNLTRFPPNNEDMAVHYSFIPTLLQTAASDSEEDRVWALRILQNISASKQGKSALSEEFALELLGMSILRSQPDEKKSAIAALHNLATDPACVGALTSTKDIMSSLVLVANDPNTQSDIRIMVCNTIGNLGLWLQTAAGKGTVPADIKKDVPLPTLQAVGWNRWD